MHYRRSVDGCQGISFKLCLDGVRPLSGEFRLVVDRKCDDPICNDPTCDDPICDDPICDEPKCDDPICDDPKYDDPRGTGTPACDSEAVLLIFFFTAIALFEASARLPPPIRLDRGLSAGAKAGVISRASSRTRTAPSSLLNLTTISYKPNFSTSMARLG